MWHPIKIEIYDLFAHRESIYEFKNNACTVIFGRNETDRGMDNNGAGKTTLFEAIVLALTNKSLRDIKKESFINRYSEDCKIIFHLQNDVLKQKLKISRQFFRSNKPVKVEIWENEVLNTNLTSVDEANKRIMDLIGVSREDLIRYFIIGQDNKYTFFTAGDSEKKEVMNRITSADMINPALEELSSRKKQKQAEYNEIDRELGEYTYKKELLEEQRQEVLSNDDTEEEIKALKEKMIRKSEEKEENEKRLKKIGVLLAAKDKEIDAITVPDSSLLKKDKLRVQKEIEEIEEELQGSKEALKAIKDELAESVTCPKCKTEFIQDSQLGLSVKEAKTLLKEAKEEMDALNRKLTVKNKKLEAVKKQMKEAARAEEIVEGLVEEKDDLIKEKKNLSEDITDIERKIKKWGAEIKALKEKKEDNQLLNSLNARIEECDKEIDKRTEKAEKVNGELEMINYWSYYMGKTGFSTYLANKSIKVIEGITNSFLRKFGVDLSVLINGFTILRSGEVREKIDVFALNDGINAEPFLGKSGGERGRINIAGILGIQHLINMSTNGRGLNLLCLDECFPGIDTTGQENIIKILEKMGITILMITQNVSDNFNNENKLYVVKSGDVSRYV